MNVLYAFQILHLINSFNVQSLESIMNCTLPSNIYQFKTCCIYFHWYLFKSKLYNSTSDATSKKSWTLEILLIFHRYLQSKDTIFLNNIYDITSPIKYNCIIGYKQRLFKIKITNTTCTYTVFNCFKFYVSCSFIILSCFDTNLLPLMRSFISKEIPWVWLSKNRFEHLVCLE